jgi:hypothetical protein
MTFRFLALGDQARLDAVGEIEAGGTFAEVRFDVERHFDNEIARLQAGQTLVLCPDLGDPPGALVAAETVYMAHVIGRVKPDRQVRTLVWLLDDFVPKH